MTRLIDADDFFRTFPELANEPYINAPTVEIDKLILIVAKRSGKRELMLNALRPRGEWMKLSNMSKRSYRRVCSQCHNISYFCGDGNYPNCPYCLADMEEVDNDD